MIGGEKKTTLIITQYSYNPHLTPISQPQTMKTTIFKLLKTKENNDQTN